MADSRALLSEELRQKVEDFAREQNRVPADVMEEAVNRYLASQRLAWFAEKMGRQMARRGITEKDVSGLVQQVRRESETRGR